MNKKIKIVTDTCSSLTKEEIIKLNVGFVETNFAIDNVLHNGYDEFTDTDEEFYKKLKDVKSVSTGCVNVQNYTDIFEPLVKDGYDVVFVGLSGGLSSSYSNACISANDLNEKYGQHVYVANSLTGSFGIAKMVEEATHMLAQGCTAEEIYLRLHNNALNILSIFVPGNLHFLTKLGRISKLVASVGSLLHISPIISTNDTGKLKIIGKALGRKKALQSIKNTFISTCDLDGPETIYIGHTNQLAEAEELAEFIKQNSTNKTIRIGYIDRTMGCHCGPNTLALFATKK